MAVPRLAARGLGAALVVAGVAATAGCGAPPGELDEETYVQVMAQLAWARTKYASTPEGDSARAAALEDFGVTGGQLEAFGERHGDDPQRMRDLWNAIRVEVDILDGVPTPESEAAGGAR